MISFDKVSKGFADQELFDSVSFTISPRERIGLVGRNGHGKTTLLRLIAGEQRPDAGEISVPRQYRLGYVMQHLTFTEATVAAEAMKGLPGEEKHQGWRAEKILAGLGFDDNDMRRHPEEFSGGFQIRINLARVLVSEPDLLLLDEPTNYLDITSIRWIESYLANWPRELILITHDRNFMDRVVTHILGIHRKQVRKIAGSTQKYYTQIAQEEEVFEKTRINDERRRKEIEQFIERFRAKARLANLVQSRVKTLSKLQRRQKLEAIEHLEFSFRHYPLGAKYIGNVRNVSFSYSHKEPLIQDMSFSIGKGDRICIIGKNGRGKTTLMKLLAGRLAAQDGTITYNDNVKTGFFEQGSVNELEKTRTVEEEILSAHDQVERHYARTICGAMMFEGDAALKRISVLSGGEKSRVVLGKLLVKPLNLLLLDEPTNHLDMSSCDALLAALDSFDGALVLVTHNELFLHALAERLIVFEGDEHFFFEGTYQRFLETRGWKNEHPESKNTRRANVQAGAGQKHTKKEARRKRSSLIAERSSVLKPLEQEILRTESAIESKELTLQQHIAQMQEASLQGDGQRIAIISQSMHVLQAEVDDLFVTLEALTEQFDAQKVVYDERLEILEEQTGRNT